MRSLKIPHSDAKTASFTDIRAASPVIIYFLFRQLTSRRHRFGGRCNAKKSDNIAASSVRKREAVVVVATMKRLFCTIILLAEALMAVQDQPRGQLPDRSQEKYGVVIEMSQGTTPDGGAQSILQLRDRLMHNDAPKRVSVSIYRRDCDGLPKLLGNAVICYGGNDEDFDEFRRKLAKAIADLELSASHPIPSHPIPSHPIPSHPRSFSECLHCLYMLQRHLATRN